MAKIGAVSVTVTARTSAFHKKMRRAAKSMRRLGKAALRVAKRIAKVGTVMTTAAVGGLTLLTKRSLENIDALAKTADKLGVTTKALAGMQLAASLTGVKMSAMEMGLQRMTRRLAEAAKGSGEAKDTIKELGLDAAALSQMGPQKAFLEIADAMAKVPTQGEKILRSFKLFDSEGVALVNTLALGREGLEAIFEKAEKYGLAVSRFDASKIEAANDAITEAKSLFTGLVNQIALAVSPAIKHVSDQFIDWGTKGTTAGDHVRSAMVDVLWMVEQIDQTVIRLGRGFFVMGKFAEIGAQAARIGWSKTLAIIAPILKEPIAFFTGPFTGLPQYREMSRENKGVEILNEQGQWVPDIIDLRKGATKAATDWGAIFTEVAKEQEIELDDIFKEFDKTLLKMGIENSGRETWMEWFERITSEMGDAAQAALGLGSAMDALDPSKLSAMGLAGRAGGLQFPEATPAGSAASQRMLARAEFAGGQNPVVGAVKKLGGKVDAVKGVAEELRALATRSLEGRPLVYAMGS